MQTQWGQQGSERGGEGTGMIRHISSEVRQTLALTLPTQWKIRAVFQFLLDSVLKDE